MVPHPIRFDQSCLTDPHDDTNASFLAIMRTSSSLNAYLSVVTQQYKYSFEYLYGPKTYVYKQTHFYGRAHSARKGFSVMSKRQQPHQTFAQLCVQPHRRHCHSNSCVHICALSHLRSRSFAQQFTVTAMALHIRPNCHSRLYVAIHVVVRAARFLACESDEEDIYVMHIG